MKTEEGTALPRYKLTIEYDGRPFVGWQSQTNGRGVQDALADAVEGFCGERVRVAGAGRTDTGVHALGQVAHIDLRKEVQAETLVNALNAHLRPAPVAVLQAEEVGGSFDARFSATRRYYAYRIVSRRAPLTFGKGLLWQVPQKLDAGAMHEAAQALTGRHDFTTFRASHCQAKSPVKTLDVLTVSEEAGEIVVRAEARSFLHNQVRSIVGSLKLVGEGRWSAADLKAALDAADRTECGPVAPPDGLYLTRVDYDPRLAAAETDEDGDEGAAEMSTSST